MKKKEQTKPNRFKVTRNPRVMIAPRLSAETVARLHEEAHRRQMTLSALISLFIEDALKHQESANER